MVDNCEHVVDELAPVVVDILERVPELRILATSRRPLRVPGEIVWLVPPLTSPDATALFADRARAASMGFDLDGRDADVAAICAELDGMPLAIELIAARAGAFTIDQLGERLADRFGLLGAERRGARPRHHTLRAATDWSHDLLDEAERRTFRRLSVFAGGATIDAAAVVCADGDVARDDVAEIVARLVDQSLLVADSGRYRMLITLGEYGRERLVAAGELEPTMRLFVGWAADLAHRSFLDWRNPGGRDHTHWMRVVDTELDNFRQALSAAIELGAFDDAARIGGSLGWFWWHSGRAAEGLMWLERLLAATDLGATVPRRPRVDVPRQARRRARARSMRPPRTRRARSSSSASTTSRLSNRSVNPCCTTWRWRRGGSARQLGMRNAPRSPTSA